MRARRPAIDPAEQKLRALLLQAFYTVCSERQLLEQLDYNLLFAKFVAGVLNLPPVNHAVRDRSALAESSNVIFRPGESKWTLKCVTERY